MSRQQQFLQPQFGVTAPAPAFAGFLDDVSNVEHVYLLFRGLTSYSGDLVRLRAEPSDREENFTWDSATQEFLDTSAVTTWLAGEDLYIVTKYDQAAAGDDITQATEASQPALTLSDATANNKPTMDAGGPYLKGAFTNGGALSQPITILAPVKWSGNDNNRWFCDDDSQTVFLFRRGGGRNLSMYAGTVAESSLFTSVWLIWTCVLNGIGSEGWFNGTNHFASNAGAAGISGVTLGANSNGSDFWVGSLTGAIIIDGNPSDADKNIVGQKFDDVYGITYTDIT